MHEIVSFALLESSFLPSSGADSEPRMDGVF